MFLAIIFIIVALLILAYVISFEYYAKKLGVITAHSHNDMTQAMIAEIKANTAPDQRLKIVDPGCGSGKLVRDIARALPHAEVTGLELFPIPYWKACLLKAVFGLSNARFLKSDFFKFDYADTDVIVVFIPDDVLHKLAQTLERGLKPGAIVLSNAYEMPHGWSAYKSDMIQPIWKARLFCYRKP